MNSTKKPAATMVIGSNPGSIPKTYNAALTITPALEK
jgi:hypothetical protein